MQVQEVPVRSILNPTGGFWREGFTHTINLYRGCALGNSLCGTFCYAQWNAYAAEPVSGTVDRGGLRALDVAGRAQPGRDDLPHGVPGSGSRGREPGGI